MDLGDVTDLQIHIYGEQKENDNRINEETEQNEQSVAHSFLR